MGDQVIFIFESGCLGRYGNGEVNFSRVHLKPDPILAHLRNLNRGFSIPKHNLNRFNVSTTHMSVLHLYRGHTGFYAIFAIGRRNIGLTRWK